MPAAIHIDEQTKISIITLRRKTSISDHEIAHKLNISEWTVIRTLREHRRLYPDDPLPAQRWSPNSRAMRRMELANRLIEENTLTRREILAKTGYRSWRSLLGMVRVYRERKGLGPMRHRMGWVKVAGKERVRIVLCAEAITAVGWRANQRIVWSTVDDEIWLTPEIRLTKHAAHWNAGDLDAQIYWERYGLKIQWREIATTHEIALTTAIAMANRHAMKYPWLPKEERKGNKGVAQVMRINKSTLRLNLNRAADLIGFKPGDQAHWEARPNHVLVIQRRTPLIAQAI